MGDAQGCLRPLAPDDYVAVVELWRRCEGVGISADDTEGGFCSFLIRNPGLSPAALATDRSLIGLAMCGHDGRRGSIYHMGVHPDHRGRGVGRALAGACLDNLARVGIYRCNAYVYGRNDDGLAFWKRIGWNLRDDLILIQRNTTG